MKVKPNAGNIKTTYLFVSGNVVVYFGSKVLLEMGDGEVGGTAYKASFEGLQVAMATLQTQVDLLVPPVAVGVITAICLALVDAIFFE